VREIESWFHEYEDGEFVTVSSDNWSRLTGSHAAPRTLIYTTKIHCLGQDLRALDVAHPVMIVGRYGLPRTADLTHFDTLRSGAGCYFLGDADPPDILAFAWLREHAAIHWLGVNDELLKQRSDSAGDLLEIVMSDSEKQAMRLLPNWCPDFRDLLGLHCSGALDRGFKIELEAAMLYPNPRPAG